MSSRSARATLLESTLARASARARIRCAPPPLIGGPGLRLDDCEVQVCGVEDVARGIFGDQGGAVAACREPPPSALARPRLLVLSAVAGLRDRAHAHEPGAARAAPVSRRGRLAAVADLAAGERL